MPHSKIKIWLCLVLALLVCIYPLYPQAPGRPPPRKPAGKNTNPWEQRFGKESEFPLRGIKPVEKPPDEFFLRYKKLDGGQSARAPKPMTYAEKKKMLSERYRNDVEFKRRFDQEMYKAIEQGIDKAVFKSFLRKDSMLDEHTSVQFVANQSDKGIDEARLRDDMKKIAIIVLNNAVLNVLPFEFQTESDCKSALKDAVKKACDEQNRVKKLPWTLKFELESDDLVFQSRDDKHPDAKLPIGTILNDLTNLTNYESIQTTPSEPRG